MYKDDLKKQIEPEKHASLAHSSEGLAAKKAEIVKTTNHFVDALESLSVQDMDSMRADFEEVFAMYKDDLKKQIEPEKHASLAHSSEGLAAKKAEIVKTTNHFVDALESLSV